MRTLGLIGGMSWESSALYYAALNRGVAQRLGGLHSAKLLLGSVDFHEIVEMQKAAAWDEAGALLADVARSLVAGGAQAIALAVNTMHKVAPQVRAAIGVPFIDIRDAVAAEVRAKSAGRVGLLGTRYVVEQPFYGEQIEAAGACKILRAPADDNESVHRIIYDELCLGVVNEASCGRVLGIVQDLQRQGAESVVLACTELPMLNLGERSPVPLINSTAIHVDACLDFMCPA